MNKTEDKIKSITHTRILNILYAQYIYIMEIFISPEKPSLFLRFVKE